MKARFGAAESQLFKGESYDDFVDFDERLVKTVIAVTGREFLDRVPVPLLWGAAR